MGNIVHCMLKGVVAHITPRAQLATQQISVLQVEKIRCKKKNSGVLCET